MPIGHNTRRRSYFVLCASVAVVPVVVGVRVKYTPEVYYAIAGIQLAVVCLSAWKLGAWAIRAHAEDRRRFAVAGGLLITSLALFSLLPGIGPPGDQTRAEDTLRYLILLINSIAVAGGLIVLKEALSEAGERFYSTLGFAAIMLAAPLYLVWASIYVGSLRMEELPSSAPKAPWMPLVSNVMDVLLFFGGALTYLATAAFAASLGRTRWLGRGATRAFVVASLLALVCLMVRGLQFPARAEVFAHWYTIPGFVVGIPAVPWLMPLMFGISLLRRAGNEQA